MNYKNITPATFLARPNRFIAHCSINGIEVVAHVKNTGRCKELLTSGATVYLEKSDNPNRKTAYSLIAVEKNGLLINMDSQVPNQIAVEAIENGTIQLNSSEPLSSLSLKREVVYKDSRFDIALQQNGENILFCEVKGVTLEENGVVLFPDAPTERGIKHLHGLIDAKKNGFDACIIFIIQLEGARYFTPNNKTHPQFGEALRLAQENEVDIFAFECTVTPKTIVATKEIPVIL